MQGFLEIEGKSGCNGKKYWWVRPYGIKMKNLFLENNWM
jgi:hypothetical protein